MQLVGTQSQKSAILGNVLVRRDRLMHNPQRLWARMPVFAQCFVDRINGKRFVSLGIVLVLRKFAEITLENNLSNCNGEWKNVKGNVTAPIMRDLKGALEIARKRERHAALFRRLKNFLSVISRSKRHFVHIAQRTVQWWFNVRRWVKIACIILFKAASFVARTTRTSRNSMSKFYSAGRNIYKRLCDARQSRHRQQ